jgi:23S rRNA (cytosine1962-C5)-methyltransferase
LQREQRRERRYDLIILDPPSYGRGAKGEVFKIGQDLPKLLARLATLLSDRPVGVLLSCHTPELTPIALRHLMAQAFADRGGGALEHGEMLLEGASDVLPVPSGGYCWWTAG